MDEDDHDHEWNHWSFAMAKLNRPFMILVTNGYRNTNRSTFLFELSFGFTFLRWIQFNDKDFLGNIEFA